MSGIMGQSSQEKGVLRVIEFHRLFRDVQRAECVHHHSEFVGPLHVATGDNRAGGAGPCGMPCGCSVNDDSSTPRRPPRTCRAT